MTFTTFKQETIEKLEALSEDVIVYKNGNSHEIVRREGTGKLFYAVECANIQGHVGVDNFLMPRQVGAWVEEEIRNF